MDPDTSTSRHDEVMFHVPTMLPPQAPELGHKPPSVLASVRPSRASLRASLPLGLASVPLSWLLGPTGELSSPPQPDKNPRAPKVTKKEVASVFFIGAAPAVFLTQIKGLN